MTLNNSSVLSPKLRYNVGDEGLTMSRRDVLERLTALGVVETGQQLPQSWGAPFFFLYGRRDGTISYMGANIYPIDVEYGLYRDEELAATIESFCLELDESPALESRPVVHVQLRKGAHMDTQSSAERLRLGLVDYLASRSRDFAESLKEDPAAGDIRLVLHEHGTGPFADTGHDDQERLRRPALVKTEDLSKVPQYGRANAVFVGATEYSGIRPLLAHWPKWIRLRRRLKRAPGFCGHYVYYKFPFTFGQVVLFEEMDQLLRFARNKLHRELMAWIVEGDGKNAKAGFVRLYDARPGATYANGLWSNEGAKGYDERFTALGNESEGPLVHPRKGA